MYVFRRKEHIRNRIEIIRNFSRFYWTSNIWENTLKEEECIDNNIDIIKEWVIRLF